MISDQSISEMSYSPGRLLDALREKLQLKNDASLAKALGIPASSVSRMRNGKIPVYPALMIRMHEVSELTIQEMREIVGDRRRKLRFGHTMSQKRMNGRWASL